MTRTFYADEPAPVRAVISFAAMREHPDDPMHDLVARTFLPARHADLIADIADALWWIERLETESAAVVLSDYLSCPVAGPALDRMADGLADEKRCDVVRLAALVASDLNVWMRGAA